MIKLTKYLHHSWKTFLQAPTPALVARKYPLSRWKELLDSEVGYKTANKRCENESKWNTEKLLFYFQKSDASIINQHV